MGPAPVRVTILIDSNIKDKAPPAIRYPGDPTAIPEAAPAPHSSRVSPGVLSPGGCP